MPYEWLPITNDAAPRAVPVTVLAWPHQSLPPAGFVGFMAATAVFIALPLVFLLGSPVFWGLLPFIVLAVVALWLAIQRNRRDGQLLETLTISPSDMTLERRNPHQATQHWQANPYWVSVQIHARKGPVPDYLTLRGAGREVEFGAFLTPAERVTLCEELQIHLAALARAPHPL